jgi:hypothetical protein
MSNPNPTTLHSAALFLLILLALIPAMAGAEDIAASTDMVVQASSLPEIKVGVTQSFVIPLLRGDNPLTQGNNIKLSVAAELSPVSLNGIGEALWTPIAFLQLNAGGRAGSGWNISLFGDDSYGIGINSPGEDIGDGHHRREIISGDAFDSLQWSAYGGLVLQFDLAAVIPGDWTHILFRAYNEGRYSAYNRAAKGESWVFENDNAQNQNGWIWYGSYVLGYQMPLSPALDTIAFMAETRKNLYKTPGGDLWGDDLTSWIFSMLFNFTITPRLGAALALQMRTLRNYETSDLRNEEGIYYKDLVLQDTYGKQRLTFYRAAVILSYKLR